MNKRNDQDLKSTHKVTIRMTDDEYNRMKTESAEERLTASEYCRTRLFPDTHKKVPRDVFIELQKMNENLSDTYSLFKKILRSASSTENGINKDMLDEARGALQELSAMAGNIYEAIRTDKF